MGLCPRHPLVQVDQVALVDARRCGIDDYEHLGGEILAPAVENHTRDIDGFRVVRALVQVEAEGRKPVLAVDDEELGLRLRQLADPVGTGCLEAQFFRGKQQYRSRDGRLGDRRLIKVLELAHLGPGKGSLEGAVGALDFGDELGDLILVGDTRRDDLLAFAVKTADEADFGEQLGSADAAEVEDAILLANLRGKHGVLPCKYGSAAGADQKYSRNRAPTAKKTGSAPLSCIGSSRGPLLAVCLCRGADGRSAERGPKRAVARGVPWANAFPEGK